LIAAEASAGGPAITTLIVLPGPSLPQLPLVNLLISSHKLLTCSSWTNKLITAMDHASVQLNIGHLDENGDYTGSFSTFGLCGQIRAKVRRGAGLPSNEAVCGFSLVAQRSPGQAS
jgi:hypothetical protein